MKKIIYIFIAFVIAAFIYIQWKKRKSISTDVSSIVQNVNPISNNDLSSTPQKGDNTISAVDPIRGDAVTAGNLIDANAGSVKGSSTSDNPIVRESENVVSISDVLGSIVALPMNPDAKVAPLVVAPVSNQNETGAILLDSKQVWKNQTQYDIVSTYSDGSTKSIPGNY